MSTWGNIVKDLEHYNDNVPKVFAPEENNITCFAGGTEMLKVARDGFYIRGVKVEADEKEAEKVYNAFKQFLVWAELNKR